MVDGSCQIESSGTVVARHIKHVDRGTAVQRFSERQRQKRLRLKSSAVAASRVWRATTAVMQQFSGKAAKNQLNFHCQVAICSPSYNSGPFIPRMYVDRCHTSADVNGSVTWLADFDDDRFAVIALSVMHAARSNLSAGSVNDAIKPS